MPVCPKCGYEYREGIETCSDCGSLLVEQQPEVSRLVSDEPLAVVYEAPDEFHSSMAQSALREAGIRFAEQRDRMMAYDNIDLSGGRGRYARLLTLESSAEKARRIVADYIGAYEKGELALPEDAPTDTDDNGRRTKF